MSPARTRPAASRAVNRTIPASQRRGAGDGLPWQPGGWSAVIVNGVAPSWQPAPGAGLTGGGGPPGRAARWMQVVLVPGKGRAEGEPGTGLPARFRTGNAGGEPLGNGG